MFPSTFSVNVFPCTRSVNIFWTSFREHLSVNIFPWAFSMKISLKHFSAPKKILGATKLDVIEVCVGRHGKICLDVMGNMSQFFLRVQDVSSSGHLLPMPKLTTLETDWPLTWSTAWKFLRCLKQSVTNWNDLKRIETILKRIETNWLEWIGNKWPQIETIWDEFKKCEA